MKQFTEKQFTEQSIYFPWIFWFGNVVRTLVFSGLCYWLLNRYPSIVALVSSEPAVARYALLFGVAITLIIVSIIFIRFFFIDQERRYIATSLWTMFGILVIIFVIALLQFGFIMEFQVPSRLLLH